MIVGFDIADEFRLSNEIHQRSADVLPKIETELRLRADIRPFDAIR